MEDDPRYGMAGMSIWLGAASILFCTTGLIPMIFGGVAVVVALLSRTSSGRLMGQAKVGIVLGLIGVVIAYAVLIAGMLVILNNDEMRRAMEQFFQDGNPERLREMLNILDRMSMQRM
jgi:hypothetical protein